MFAAKIISHRISSNVATFIFLRSYSPRYPNYRINYQEMKSLKDVPEILEDPEGFGDLESDFMDVHESHKHYEKEMIKHRKKVQLWIVKNKYFKEKQPNLLTYAEKEQIKLLNSRDPDEWTAEKLSESFPANPEVIEKIIKANWVALSKKRILKHDETVMRNWTLYKEGKLNVSESLKEHIDKFANRNPSDINNMKMDFEPKPSLPIPKTNEFSNIITSCKNYTNEKKPMIESSECINNKINNCESIITSKNSSPVENETYLTDKIVDRRYMRLEDLKKMKNVGANEIKNEEPNDELDNSKLKIQMENPFQIQKFESNEITICKEDMKKYDVTPIKQRIHIPRKLWKRDATYKVEDCYYDDDGQFLYRVPGMTGGSS